MEAGRTSRRRLEEPLATTITEHEGTSTPYHVWYGDQRVYFARTAVEAEAVRRRYEEDGPPDSRTTIYRRRLRTQQF